MQHKLRAVGIFVPYDRSFHAYPCAWANIKLLPNRINNPAFSPFLYRYRNFVERFINKIKHFRILERSPPASKT